MSVDPDIVRYASPWLGPAARVLEALARLGTGAWRPDEIADAAGSGLEAGDVLQVLTCFAPIGVCEVVDADELCWTTTIDAPELRRLATLLRGADHYRRLKTDAPNLELVVTLPMAPSFLERELNSLPGRPGGFLPTTDAFQRLAQAAVERLVILSPFIDARGFTWARELFTQCAGSVNKVLVLRDRNAYAAELGVLHSPWLQSLQVEVHDYHLSHELGRKLPIETFHSKIVIADARMAYVGSANLLGSSRGTSLETGVIVDGRAALQVGRLVDAVLKVARRM